MLYTYNIGKYTGQLHSSLLHIQDRVIHILNMLIVLRREAIHDKFYRTKSPVIQKNRTSFQE